MLIYGLNQFCFDIIIIYNINSIFFTFLLLYRLSGLENGLLGLNSRVNAVLWAQSAADIENIDVICFGHLLYEMCTGYELSEPLPTRGHLQLDLERNPQVKTL